MHRTASASETYSVRDEKKTVALPSAGEEQLSPRTALMEGVKCYQKNDIKMSVKLLSSNHDFFKQKKDESMFAAYNDYHLGMGYNLLNKYADAQGCLERALYVAKKLELEALIPNIFFELGRSYQKLGNQMEAIAYFKSAVNEFVNSVEDYATSPSYADSLVQLGTCYADQNDFKLSNESLRDSLTILEKLIEENSKTNKDKANEYLHLYANAQYTLGSNQLLENEDGIRHFEISYKIFKRLNSIQNANNALLMLCITYLKKNLVELTLQKLTAINSSHEDDIFSIIIKEFLLGLCYAIIDNEKQSLHHLNTVVERFLTVSLDNKDVLKIQNLMRFLLDNCLPNINKSNSSVIKLLGSILNDCTLKANLANDQLQKEYAHARELREAKAQSIISGLIDTECSTPLCKAVPFGRSSTR